MNASTETPASDEERTARHRRICQRLIELAMQLTEAAAQRALAHLTSEQPPPQPDATPDEEPARPATDPTVTFVRLASAVRQAMAHEARIDAAEAAAQRATQSSQSGHAPRYHHPAGEDFRAPILHPILRQAAEAQPNRPGLADQVARELETQILIDIHNIASAGLILTSICQEYGLQPDYSLVPQDIIDAIYPEGPPPQAKIRRYHEIGWEPP